MVVKETHNKGLEIFGSFIRIQPNFDYFLLTCFFFLQYAILL